ncbi:glycosyltransferase [Celeribacter ethanolicus]|uniref:glycosyltransferase n=1 Tax=Celeribacter ethanolicus TaxID=1758178 RepID=UPI0009D69ED9|nr:glycosyltransferase [Celeribacter ethanolicus]
MTKPVMKQPVREKPVAPKAKCRVCRHPALAPRSMLTPLFSRRRRLWYGFLAGLWFLASLWFWTWWFQPAHIGGVGQFALITLGLVWVWSMQAYFMVIFLAAHRSAAPDPEPGQYRVAMIVTKTPSEPFEVIRPTLEAMLAQDYPHDTWLADEHPTEEVTGWCAAHGVHISSRYGLEVYHQKEWPRRTRCKEGNLAYFYDTWGYRLYDIVSQLDSDHVPAPGYLREMVRPFADPEVGYVSAPSICGANAKGHWAARTRLYVEAAFHGIFQAGYTRLLTPMCIGSHYAVRTRALKEAGGLGPELAEDHSTTMLISAAGWRGVHAIDAFALGDGPATLPDLVTQEFQWSRSLVSLLLRYTPDYLPKLPLRLKALFLLCQLWYVFFALAMAMAYVAPVLAVLFDFTYADVTYPSFIAHGFPMALIPLVIVRGLKRDGLLRPMNAKILAWEKILFVALQWPWVLWGVAMAVRDRISGHFVDFRITPKGAAAQATMPMRIIMVYAVLALGAILPVMLRAHLVVAPGFYLLTLLNAVIYVILLAVAILHHVRENHIRLRNFTPKLAMQSAVLIMIMAFFANSVILRGQMGLLALSYGLEPLQVMKVEYVVAGAGQGQPGDVHLEFAPEWFGDLAP